MFDEILPMLGNLFGLNPILLVILLVVFAIVAFKFFQYLLKILFTGIAFGAFPIVTHFLGVPIIPLTLENILICVLLGIIMCMVYSTVSTVSKIIKIVLWPFRKMFGSKKKEKIIIKEVR